MSFNYCTRDTLGDLIRRHNIFVKPNAYNSPQFYQDVATAIVEDTLAIQRLNKVVTNRTQSCEFVVERALFPNFECILLKDYVIDEFEKKGISPVQMHTLGSIRTLNHTILFDMLYLNFM